MSKSYRDLKPRYLAIRRLRLKSGDPKPLPRIITRRPSPGDIHPLEPNILRGALRLDAPVEYLYGLTAIELRARQGTGIGQPYGLYRPGEKSIVLYSLPLQWELPSASENVILKLRAFGASVLEEDKRVVVSWNSRVRLAVWFFVDVVAHELGHHYRNQYKISVGRPGSMPHEEWQAELHAARIEKALRKRWSEKTKNDKPPSDT